MTKIMHVRPENKYLMVINIILMYFAWDVGLTNRIIWNIIGGYLSPTYTLKAKGRTSYL